MAVVIYQASVSDAHRDRILIPVVNVIYLPIFLQFIFFYNTAIGNLTKFLSIGKVTFESAVECESGCDIIEIAN